ncbi:hypothetical protein [Dickeya oryzae]
MKSGVMVSVDNSDAILKALKEIGNRDVLVGIPSDRATRDDGMEINNAELGYIHSYGATIRIRSYTITLPPRPFLDLGIQAVRDETLALLKRAATAVFDGKSSTAEQYLNQAGTLAANSAKKRDHIW